jgi:threonine dehydratase
MTELTLDLIAEAEDFLQDKIRRTPLESSPALSAALGAPAWLKLEFLQETGSFKLRGALFRMSRLTPEEQARGVATCSAGNHGKAVAYAARELGIPSTIYVPASVDEAKDRAMRELGATVIPSRFQGFDQTQAWALEEIRGSGQTFISAFDDPWIMAGNGGSLAAEIAAELPDAKTFLLPVSGGGLAAGFAFYARTRRAGARIVACQHEGSPALKLSLDEGQAVTQMPAIRTAAGGLEGGVGKKTFEVLKGRVDQVELASEREILSAARWILDQHQYLIEPSAAVTLAVGLRGISPTPEGPVVVVLSGRNVSLATVQKLLAA